MSDPFCQALVVMAVIPNIDGQPNYEKVKVTVSGISLDIAAIRQISPSKPLVLFLRGFGGTKEDYVDFLNIALLSSKYSFLAYDAPGCGETEYPVEQTEALLSQLSIPFLVTVAEAVLSKLEVDRFHLVGHSMGGLTGLLLAHKLQDRVLSFVNMKGNLAPEDCFLSRQVFGHQSDDPERFFEDFVLRTSRTKSLGSALYAISLRHKVHAPQGRVTSAIFRSMVQLSDEGNLLDVFLGLQDGRMKRMFMYGEENRSLSYLATLKSRGIMLAEVEKSGHFVMYSNPPTMWRYVGEFLARHK